MDKIELKEDSFKSLKESCNKMTWSNVSKYLSNYLFYSMPQDILENKLMIKNSYNTLFMGTRNQYFNIIHQDIHLTRHEKTFLLEILNNFYRKGLTRFDFEPIQEFHNSIIYLLLTINKLDKELSLLD